MANNASDSTDDKFSLNQANAKWPDLYALLQVAPDADVDTVRQRVRESYTEATLNTDHRNIERRIHYQTMAERIIPQARRILLDPNVRARYDRELALHKAADPKGQDYTTFLSNIYSAPDEEEETESIPGKYGESIGELSVAASAAVAEATPPPSPTPVTPAATRARRDRTEVPGPPPAGAPAAGTTASRRDEAARDSGTPSANEAIAGIGDAGIGDAGIADTGVAESVAVSTPSTPIIAEAVAAPGEPTAAEEARRLPSVTEPEPEQPTTGSGETSGEAPDALYASVLRPEGPDVEAHSTAQLNHEDVTKEFRARRNKERVGRISLGDNELSRRAAGSSATKGKRVVSQSTQMLATGICAALLTMYIMRPQDGNDGVRNVSLNIAYSSDMQGFMESAEREFEASDQGSSIQIDQRPTDSRAAMTQVLSGTSPVDLWIPAESLWSDRFNEVAGGKKVKSIALARSIALSPCVLVARADKASLLHQRFPSGIIPNWEALRNAIKAGAAGHFGLTDPTVSGAGAIARYFMASEWAQRTKTPFNKGSVDSNAMWNWMAGFEDNIPGSAKLTADMVKDLALGTADRYWWAIAYESDAIAWMNKGKKIDVFYLPQTNYADHPLCYIDRNGMTPATAQARASFEQFVRSVPMQKILLQNGLRPTEIELTTDVQGNPFTGETYKARGIKRGGFKANERINYRILNAINAAWNKRYGQ